MFLPTARLELAIFGLGDRRLIHWATRADIYNWKFHVMDTLSVSLVLFKARASLKCMNDSYKSNSCVHYSKFS